MKAESSRNFKKKRNKAFFIGKLLLTYCNEILFSYGLRAVKRMSEVRFALNLTKSKISILKEFQKSAIF